MSPQLATVVAESNNSKKNVKTQKNTHTDFSSELFNNLEYKFDSKYCSYFIIT